MLINNERLATCRFPEERQTEVSRERGGGGRGGGEIACFIKQVPLLSCVLHQNLPFFVMKRFRENAVNFRGSRSRVTRQEVVPSPKLSSLFTIPLVASPLKTCTSSQLFSFTS